MSKILKPSDFLQIKAFAFPPCTPRCCTGADGTEPEPWHRRRFVLVETVHSPGCCSGHGTQRTAQWTLTVSVLGCSALRVRVRIVALNSYVPHHHGHHLSLYPGLNQQRGEHIADIPDIARREVRRRPRTDDDDDDDGVFVRQSCFDSVAARTFTAAAAAPCSLLFTSTNWKRVFSFCYEIFKPHSLGWITRAVGLKYFNLRCSIGDF